MNSDTIQAPNRYVTLKLSFSTSDIEWLTSQDYGVRHVHEKWGEFSPATAHPNSTVAKVNKAIGDTIALVLSTGMEIDLGRRLDRGAFITYKVRDEVLSSLRSRKKNGSQVSKLIGYAVCDGYVIDSIRFTLNRILYWGHPSIGSVVGDDIPNIKGQPPYNARGYDPFDR